MITVEVGKASAATLQPVGPRLRCCVRVSIPLKLLDRPPKLVGHGGLQPAPGPSVQGATCACPWAWLRPTRMMLVFARMGPSILGRRRTGGGSVVSNALEIAHCAVCSREPRGYQAPLIRSLMAYYILGNMIHNVVDPMGTRGRYQCRWASSNLIIVVVVGVHLKARLAVQNSALALKPELVLLNPRIGTRSIQTIIAVVETARNWSS